MVNYLPDVVQVHFIGIIEIFLKFFVFLTISLFRLFEKSKSKFYVILKSYIIDLYF